MKKWSRDNSLFPNLNTKKLLLQSRLLAKLFKSSTRLPQKVDTTPSLSGGCSIHLVPLYSLFSTPSDV